MKKMFGRHLMVAMAGTACLLQAPATHAGQSPRSEIEELKQQVRQLMDQNQQLSERLGEMEKGMQAQPAADKAAIEEEAARQVQEKTSGQGINEFVSLGGSIEADFKTGEDFSGDRSSEFVLDTVELIMDVKVTEWATGKIVVDYDGDDEDRLYLDEANITLGKTESFPFFLTGGKIYAPFGDFSTSMIQDPLTQTLAEINPEGVIVGYEHNGFSASLFGYNGMNESDDPADDDNDAINGFGASLRYSLEREESGFDAGVAWVNNLADAGTITDMLEENEVYAVGDQVPAVSLHGKGTYKGLSLAAEYITALDAFAVNELAYGEAGAEPSAWNSELSYTTQVLDKETVLAVGYQKTWEAVALELPEQRYIASAAVGLFEGTTLAFEYFFDEDYATEDGGTGNDGHGFTTRLAYEF